MHPFYELYQCNKTTKLGSRLLGYKLVQLPDSMKNWQHEYIMLKGGEWGYMLGFNEYCNPGFRVPRRELNDDVLESLQGVVKTFKP